MPAPPDEFTNCWVSCVFFVVLIFCTLVNDFVLKMYACCDLFFLDSGRIKAKKLRDLARSGPAEPRPLRQLPDETVDEEFGNVTMSIDFWESGGGGR